MIRQNKRIREGDTVIVLAGNDKGRIGKVLSRTKDTAIVQGINVHKKNVRKTQNTPGRQINIEMPIHMSNLVLCVDEKPVKLKVREAKDGERVLVYERDGKECVHRAVKKAPRN